MMKHAMLFFLLTMVGFTQVSMAQVVSEKPHKIVIQLTSGDTTVFKGLMKQLTNMTKAAPNATIEVVCHGPGINLLVTEQTTVAAKMKELTEQQKVSFVACENTLKEKKIDKAAILPFAHFTAAGIIYIVEKQEAGWSYIKAGN